MRLGLLFWRAAVQLTLRKRQALQKDGLSKDVVPGVLKNEAHTVSRPAVSCALVPPEGVLVDELQAAQVELPWPGLDPAPGGEELGGL